MDFVFLIYNFIFFILLGIITQMHNEMNKLKIQNNNHHHNFFSNSNKIHSKVHVSFDMSDFNETE